MVSGASSLPVCIRVGRRIGRRVLSNRLRRSRVLPSLQRLTGSLGVDMLAAAQTCGRLRRRNFVADHRNGKFFMVSDDSGLVQRRLVRRMRGGLGDTVLTTRQTSVASRRLVGLLQLLLRMGRR